MAFTWGRLDLQNLHSLLVKGLVQVLQIKLGSLARGSCDRSRTNSRSSERRDLLPPREKRRARQAPEDRDRISAAARSPERMAPSMPPYDMVAVSVPAQCTRPKGWRRSDP